MIKELKHQITKLESDKYSLQRELSSYLKDKKEKEAKIKRLEEKLREYTDAQQSIKEYYERQKRQECDQLRKTFSETLGKMIEDKRLLQKKESQLEAELTQARKEKEDADSLNQNLIRIARERANQDRDLKKSAWGYLLISTAEDEDGMWRSTIQTYYLITVNICACRDNIVKEITADSNIADVDVYAYRFRSYGNYWGIDIYHKKPLLINDRMITILENQVRSV